MLQQPLGPLLQDPGVAAGASGPKTSGGGSWLKSQGILGTLGVSSLWSWVPGGRGGEGKEEASCPRPWSPLFVMHFLLPRIPFVLRVQVRPHTLEREGRGFRVGGHLLSLWL